MKDYGFSAGKTQWKELIDYWFAGGSGMDALEGAVKDTSARLGAPPSKRKVIMVLPDPIIYKVYDGKGNGKGDPGSTVYWGELNGRKMDFSTAEDRIAAYKWYVDEVRRRFDLGNYQYIDLAGFYIISEELVTPGDGWNHELKKSDEIIPPLAEYLHAINQSLNWVPYNRAAGYKKWQQLGVDYAYMQPNYFWEGQKSLSQFFSDVRPTAGHGIRIRRGAPRGQGRLRHLQEAFPRIHVRSQAEQCLRHKAAELLPRHQRLIRPVEIDGSQRQGVLPRILPFRTRQPDAQITINDP